MSTTRRPETTAGPATGGWRHLDPKEIPVRDVQNLLLGGVAPRPIALVSTVSLDGARNLSPFSFFNAFGSNPPTVAFSPARRQRDASVKHTYDNLLSTKECVIQAVTYAMAQQVSLASTEYPAGADEFVKSGLTPIPSDVVAPPRVLESPFQMECILKQMINLGEGKGSGNLAICEVVRFHVAEDLFVNGIIHPDAIDLIGRNSADFYTRASGDAIFYIKKPIETRGIGLDQLPAHIRNSDVFTGNNLGQLGNTERLPSPEEVEQFISDIGVTETTEDGYYRMRRRQDYTNMLRAALYLLKLHHPKAARFIEETAKLALDTANDTEFAWKAALYVETARRLLGQIE